MKKIILATLFAFLLLPSLAFAQDDPYQYCQDADTLIIVKNVTVQVPELNRTRTLNVNEPIRCNYGCQNDECLKPPWIMWTWVFGIVIVMVVLYLILRPK